MAKIRIAINGLGRIGRNVTHRNMNTHPLKNWIPFRLDFHEKELHCRWLYVGDKKYTEPFFHETTGKCRIFEETMRMLL